MSADVEAAREIYAHFARTGEPPDGIDPAALRALADRHLVALDDDGRIRMAFPFAAHRESTRVEAGGRTWWGNCAWGGLTATGSRRTGRRGPSGRPRRSSQRSG